MDHKLFDCPGWLSSPLSGAPDGWLKLILGTPDTSASGSVQICRCADEAQVGNCWISVQSGTDVKMQMSAQTLCCANTLDDGLLQVTPQDVRVVDAGTGALVHQWKAPAGLHINTASASPTQVRSASCPGRLARYLRCDGRRSGAHPCVKTCTPPRRLSSAWNALKEASCSAPLLLQPIDP